MKVAELLEKRRQNWQELETFCESFKSRRKAGISPQDHARFAALYRAACADLALADSYQLPPNTVQYLHRLVGRAHNQLYRSKRFDFAMWNKMLLQDVPQAIFNDRCVQLMSCVFWGLFFISAWLAYSPEAWPGYAEQMIGDTGIDRLETSFAQEINGRDPTQDIIMASFYIRHNTTIGLQCFVGGLLVIPGMFITGQNAVALGASFGYMFRPDVPQGKNFIEFVTAHGPFELTAIVLSAGAGLRLGMSWIVTNGMTRLASLEDTAQKAMPVMAAAMLCFFFAALIEGFISPSALPYFIKATVAVLSSGALMFYFVVLGFPRE
ncbi:MAG: putative membrane protein SpoIIM required for sporulation [Pirellulaceae bacterium]|jgi:uncharacterized membrane protein SpoIIM required for sporulation